MGTMNMGYYYDRAKEGNNSYDLVIDGLKVIRNGDYKSVLHNFKNEVSYYKEHNVKTSILMVKTYDKRTKEQVYEVIREFNID